MSNQPIRGQQYIFYLTLVSRATGQFQSNPTIAAGDFQISKDGTAYANLGTLPSVEPASSKSVKVTLSATEMSAGNVNIIGSDQAGAEWDDVFANIQPLSWLTPTDFVNSNVVQWASGTVVAPNIAGIPQVDTVAISADTSAANNLETMLDGTGGGALSLGQLLIINTSGNAIHAESTGNDGFGIYAKGDGGGSGILGYGGATGHGAYFRGGDTDGNGALIQSLNSDALSAIGSAAGIYASGGLFGIEADPYIFNLSDNEELTVSNITDAVWDEAISGHLTSGTTGRTLASRMPTGTVTVNGIVNSNVVQWASGTVVAPNLTGVPKVDLTAIDGLTTDGNNATLNLKSLNINNDAGNGIDVLGSSNGAYLIGSAGVALELEGAYAGLEIVSDNVNSDAVALYGSGAGVSIRAPKGIIGNITGSMVGNIYGYVGMVTGTVLRVLEPIGISTGTFINAIADQVWDEAIAGHLSAGSTGEKLNNAGAAGNPWSESLPGLYVPGQAGYILASRMPTGTVLVGDKTGFSLSSPQVFDLIGNITGTFSGYTTPPTAIENADALLKRDWNSVTGEAARSVLNALRKIRNKVSFNGTNTLTITKEDDATTAYTQSVVEDPNQDPFKEVG